VRTIKPYAQGPKKGVEVIKLLVKDPHKIVNQLVLTPLVVNIILTIPNQTSNQAKY
jgi:hypothetical protein